MNEELQSKIDALEALVFELQANQNTQDDLSTYNGGHFAENQADEHQKPAFAFREFVYTGSNITGVKIVSTDHCIVLNRVSVSDDGTQTKTMFSTGASPGSGVAFETGSFIASLSEGTNIIFLKTSVTDDSTYINTYVCSQIAPYTIDDGFLYTDIAKINITGGIDNPFGVDWNHTGSLFLSDMSIGPVITSAILSGDLISGYTLDTIKMNIRIGSGFIIRDLV